VHGKWDILADICPNLYDFHILPWSTTLWKQVKFSIFPLVTNLLPWQPDARQDWFVIFYYSWVLYYIPGKYEVCTPYNKLLRPFEFSMLLTKCPSKSLPLPVLTFVHSCHTSDLQGSTPQKQETVSLCASLDWKPSVSTSRAQFLRDWSFLLGNIYYMFWTCSEHLVHVQEVFK
jgi:hypothetical protein